MRVFLTILLLMVMWSLLSGMFDALHLGSGLIVALLIALGAERWRYPERLPILRMVAYTPWLLRQMVASNLHVARLVLTPDLPIAPRFVECVPRVKGPHAMTLMGCSITLTPGTVTVDLEQGRMLVHTLDEASMDLIVSGELAQRVARVYGQEPEDLA
jgi:multicomponent Na+:H+ antiporter subunit E